MKFILHLTVSYVFLNVLFLSAFVRAQTNKPFSEQATASSFRVGETTPGSITKVGKLYITVGGRERKIADEAVDVWIINGGQEIVYSAMDGAGGFENEGQSLRVYDLKTDKTRKILSEYFIIDEVSEVNLSTGAIVLLVKMSDGAVGASYFAVVDPKRGEVFFQKWAELTETTGDQITLGIYREDDWTAINEEGRTVKPYKTEKHDLKAIIKRKVINTKPDNAVEISRLVKELADENEMKSRSAAAALIEIGPKVIDPLIESLKQVKFCDYQFSAVQVIRKIDEKQEIVKSILFDVAGGKCEYRYPPEKYLPDANFSSVVSQWFAAEVLFAEVEGGIVLVTELIKEGRGLYGGLHAFRGFFEMLAKNRSDKIEVKQETIRDIKAAIPILVKVLDIDRERMRCDYYQIIQALQSSGIEELEVEAKRAMQGKTVDCAQ